MKNLFIAIVMAIMLAGVSLAQTVSAPHQKPQQADKSTKPRIAVLEFVSQTSNPNWNRETSALFQRNLIKELTGTFDVPTTEQTLIAVVRSGKIAQVGATDNNVETAVKIGKLLGVNYVVMGEVSSFGNGPTKVVVKVLHIKPTRVVVRIDATDELDPSLMKHGTGTLSLGQTAEVIKPVIQQLTASLKAADL